MENEYSLTYRRAHQNVEAVRGPARNQLCEFTHPIDTHADTWAFNREHYREMLTTAERFPYSRHPEDYRALCARHHKNYDLAAIRRGNSVPLFTVDEPDRQSPVDGESPNNTS